MTRRHQHYPPELRERAVRMVFEVTPNYDSQWAAINAVAQKLGVGTAETVRKWVRQAEVDAGQRPGSSSSEEPSGPRCDPARIRGALRSHRSVAAAVHAIRVEHTYRLT
jgi:transposase